MVNKTKYAGTQTEKNVEAAFAGESQARNKYTYFLLVILPQMLPLNFSLFVYLRTLSC